MSDINFGNPFTDITAESLEEAAEQRFASPPSPEATDEGGDAQLPPSSEVEAESQSPTPDSIRIGERDYSRAEVESWANFDSLLRSDPRLGQVIYQHLYGETPSSPVPSSGGVGPAPVAGGNLAPPANQPGAGWGSPLATPSSVGQSGQNQPPQIDPELLQDPAVKFLYDRIQQQDALLSNYHQEISRLGSITSSRVQADSQTVIDTVVQEFKSQYGIDDATVNMVRQAAARLEVIPSIISRGIDPITGQPTDPNPLNAVRRAMEIAAHSVPEVRDRIIAQQQQLQQSDNLRKQRLNGVGGSSRPIPRNTPAPTNPQDIRAAMVQEVAAAMNGHGNGIGE